MHASQLSAARSAGCEAPDGPFVRWFAPADAAPLDDALLRALAATMCSTTETDDGARRRRGSRLQAGYTYFGQFIAHDLSFDAVPFGTAAAGLPPNLRTPRFDLDGLYGDGPAGDDDLYEPDGLRLRLAPGGHDLLRTEDGRAYLKDHRNDSNRIVSQLHAAFARFHNRVVGELLARRVPQGAVFAAARRSVCWHYQWLVLRDLLPVIAGSDTLDALLPPQDVSPPNGRRRATFAADALARLRLMPADEPAFVPIEFSGAVGRFGHSMVRPDYRLNTRQGMSMLFDIGCPQADEADDLRGYRPFPVDHAVDWRLFFAPAEAPRMVQLARPIDTQIARPLFHLPVKVAEQHSAAGRTLAYRNLRRGEAVLGLPSGQQVAAEMARRGVALAEADVIGRGVAFRLSGYQAVSRDDVGGSGVDLDTLERAIGERTPLWYYVLKEAAHFHRGERLGPLGGRLVAEVYLGLMLRDPTSFLHAEPAWTPSAGRCGCRRDGQFAMVDLLAYAQITPRPAE